MESSIVHSEEAVMVRALPNGLTVTLESLPHVRSVSAGVWIKTGSVNEPPNQGGISHFIEHLLFKGTSKRSARELVEAIECRGGQINAFTTRDYTCIYVKVLDDHWAAGIDVLCDIVKNSRLNDVEKERNVILEEIASIEDVPEELAHDLFAERMWPEHPLGRPIPGTAQCVQRLTYADLADYYHRWYHPGNLIISVAGHIDSEAVFDEVSAQFDNLPARSSGAPTTTPPEFSPGLETAIRDIGQSHVCFGFPGPTPHSEERYVYDILCSALGGGSTSRLFEKVREDEGLAYAIYSFHSAYHLAGMFGVYAAVAPENLDKTLELCANELRDFRDNPISESELQLNREQLKGGLLMALENTSSRSSRLAKNMIYHNRVVPVEELVDGIDRVTPEHVQALAQSIFQPEKLCLVVVGPHRGERLKTLAL